MDLHGGRTPKPPPRRSGSSLLFPDGHRFLSGACRIQIGCRRSKGGIDSSHVSFLHRGDLETDPIFKGAKGNRYNMGDLMPVFDVVESPGGLYIGARRNADNGNYYWRITQWVMPAFTMIPPRGDHPVHGHFWISIDDEHCWAWSFDYLVDRLLGEEQIAAMKAGKGIHPKYVPGTFRPLANRDNDYLMDRAAQKSGRTYSGIEGFAMQDASLQESMGPIADRSKEHLVGTDKGIVLARRRLMRSAKDLLEQGTVPPGVDPAHRRVLGVCVAAARSSFHTPRYFGALRRLQGARLSLRSGRSGTGSGRIVSCRSWRARRALRRSLRNA